MVFDSPRSLPREIFTLILFSLVLRSLDWIDYITKPPFLIPNSRYNIAYNTLNSDNCPAD